MIIEKEKGTNREGEQKCNRERREDFSRSAAAPPPPRWDGGRIDRLVTKWSSEITTAALTFESRWTRAALARTEPGLARRLAEALDLWRAAVDERDEDRIQEYGPMVCRGYSKCVDHMCGLGVPEDAYLFGKCPETGFIVAIGSKASAARVSALRPGTPHYTPDEIAMLLALPELSLVNRVMARFPGAEIVETRTSEERTCVLGQ